MSDMSFTSMMRQKASALNLPVAFPDAEDTRTLNAAKILSDEKIARPLLVGNAESIKRVATENNISLEGISIVDPERSEYLEEFANILFERRKSKGMTYEQALATVKLPIYFAGMMLDTSWASVGSGLTAQSAKQILRPSLRTMMK
jgi:phosphate acetyltransferase